VRPQEVRQGSAQSNSRPANVGDAAQRWREALLYAHRFTIAGRQSAKLREGGIEPIATEFPPPTSEETARHMREALLTIRRRAGVA